MQSELTPENSWKRNMLLVGTIAGAIVGLITAYFLARTVEEENGHNPNFHMDTTDALRVGVNVIGLMRGVADLGKKR